MSSQKAGRWCDCCALINRCSEANKSTAVLVTSSVGRSLSARRNWRSTSEAASLLGLPDLGRLTVGSSASLLAVRSLLPVDLAAPEWMMIDGRKVV